MNLKLLPNEVFGFIKPYIDVHTLGITTISHLLRDSGYRAFIAPAEISEAIVNIQKINNFYILKKWILDNHITRVGFSYRLDPQEACDYFCRLYYQFQEHKMFAEKGGCIRGIFFAGLPDACRLVKKELGNDFLTFPGDETPVESLKMLGVPESKFPKEFHQNNSYDIMRWDFAKCLIADEKYKLVSNVDHLGYPSAGTDEDTYSARLKYCKKKHSLPIIRLHAGPYNPNRLEALKEFKSWIKQLKESQLLDVLSIGSSQLTQGHFGEDWNGLPNGGGIPINSKLEYAEIKEIAKPMLVRTYAGTKNVPDMAIMHEKCLNISWHALSFWWFCEIDGRGNNTVLENLREHFEAIRYIASTGKPLEPNVPHHFAFRGADDITYILSGYLAAKAAKKLGIKHLILQIMLNTPKYTLGIQDLAKGRVLLKLVRELEDDCFHISLQSRAGLDFFSPNFEKAKVQLAAVTALMDDLEPENENSPQIIHVVSYSEAVRLATPSVMIESIQITLESLNKYRYLRKQGLIENMAYHKDITERVNGMYDEAKEAISILERYLPNLYTPEGFYQVFKQGFFPVPYMIDVTGKYSAAINWSTSFKNGGIRVIDEEGNIIRTSERYRQIIANNR